MGPLHGVRVIEIAGLGAAPYGCMMLADMGAEVVRIDRIGGRADTSEQQPLLRNRRSMTLDLKNAAGRDVVLAMCEKADVIVEAFRPGVAERLGIGPDDCLARNPRIIYARMTGWGQTGPLAQQAGHDINYIGLTGLLHQVGLAGKPVPPLNIVGDFGGGGLLMAYGIVCALRETRQSGKGQVVDAAMLDGALSFMAMFFGDRVDGRFNDRTGQHMLAGAAPYYDTYECADGHYLSVGPLERQFLQIMVERLQLDPARWLESTFPDLKDDDLDERWPRLKRELAEVFRSQPRAHWLQLFDGSDACIAPVLTLAEAATHPHNVARQSFIEVGGVQQQAPAPRFSRTVPAHPQAPPKTGADTESVLKAWCIDPDLCAAAKAVRAL